MMARRSKSQAAMMIKKMRAGAMRKAKMKIERKTIAACRCTISLKAAMPRTGSTRGASSWCSKQSWMRRCLTSYARKNSSATTYLPGSATLVRCRVFASVCVAASIVLCTWSHASKPTFASSSSVRCSLSRLSLTTRQVSSLARKRAGGTLSKRQSITSIV